MKKTAKSLKTAAPGASADVNPLKDIGGSAVISDAEAIAKANMLFEAMRWSGTDEDLIYSTLKGCTKADFSLIYLKFGLRPYNSFFGDSSSFFSKDLDLIAWLVEELNKNELRQLVELAPELSEIFKTELN